MECVDIRLQKFGKPAESLQLKDYNQLEEAKLCKFERNNIVFALER